MGRSSDVGIPTGWWAAGLSGCRGLFEVFNRRPASLEGALHRVAESFVGVDWSIQVDGDERQLPMKTEAALLRIGQGAMGNVAKHANATRCAVTLPYSADEIRLDVVDDGDGFVPQDVADRPAGLGHIGINAMRQRAARSRNSKRRRRKRAA